MNKKILFLILSTYMTTSMIPTLAFADNNKDIIDVTTLVAYDSITESTSESKEETKISIKYLDLNGDEVHPEDTNATIEANTTYIAPASIDNKYATSVRINGETYAYISGIILSLDKGYESINIEWIYEDSMPTIMYSGVTTLIHKSFFPEPTKFESYNEKVWAFPTNNKYNVALSSDNLEYLYSKLNKDIVAIGCVNTTNNFNSNDWLKNIINNPNFIGINNISIDTSDSKSPQIEMYIQLTEEEYEQYFKNSNTKTIYAYKIDEESKKLILVGKLEVFDDSFENEGKLHVLLKGNISEAINSDIIYSAVEIDVNTNEPVTDNKEESDDENKDNSTDDKKEEDKDNTNKENNDKDTVDKDTEVTYEGPYGVANVKGLGSFTITYNQYLEKIDELKENSNSENIDLSKTFVAINGDEGLDFSLNLSLKNLENVFKARNNNSEVKVNLTENISGMAKKFNDLYKSKVSQIVTIESSQLNSFETENIIKVKNTGHVYLASNANDGKVIYLGEQTKDSAISTKSDLDNMTVFVTNEKIALNEDGTLPDTGGIGPVVMIGGITFVLAGGYIVLGKRKK